MKRNRNPPGVHEFESRHGRTVYYLRRPGHLKKRLLIPDGALPWSPSFMEVYEAAMASLPERPQIGAGRTVAGSVDAALVSYYQSPTFTGGLAKSTQGNRRAILESFRKDHGTKRIAMMHAQALQAILSKRSPIAAKNWRKALRGFIDHCLGAGLIKVDPLAAVKLQKAKSKGGHHTWTEDEISRFKERHPTGTKARLALELLLQTGVARSDVVRMGSQHVKAGKLSMRRKKTGVQFDIPLLPDLVAELALHARTDSTVECLSYLITEQGKAFTAAGFGGWFGDRCIEAKVPGRAHGLRKAAAVRHALNGATAPELMAWFGWRTIGEASRYIEMANRIRLAESAGAKMRTEVGPPSNPVGQNEQKAQ